ncbi:MAG: hypothetical protein KKA68_21245 [Gammaproteobacteria bacterium]|nr:hypothetical protein [Gammaproteobacteria bacterium]
MITTKPFSPILEGGLTELVGINEKVDQNDYSGSVGVDVSPGPQPSSGVIRSFAFYATEDGSGAVQDSAGILYVLDADPAVASGDTTLAAAEWPTVIGKVDVAQTEWSLDAGGGVAYINDQPVWYHDLTTLYFVWKQTDATGLNDAAGDDEQLEFNFWYERYS